AGAQSDGLNFHPSISADGRFVAFESYATNLVANDFNGSVADVFLHDRLTGVTTLRSVSSTGAPGNSGSYSPIISADGRWLAFKSYATNLVPIPFTGNLHLFLQERVS